MLRFDNLTGDPALDWIAAEAQGILLEEFTGAPRVAPSAAQSVEDAYLGRPTRLVHGYFELRGGRPHFEISLEDAARHKMIRTAEANGEPLGAINTVARTLVPDARAFSTSNPDAASAWARGDDSRAVSLDPDFGAAWQSWAESRAAAGDSAGALETAAKALARPALRFPIERARIEILSATLDRDQTRVVTAMERLASLAPGDPSVWGSLADLEMKARRFPEAAHAYSELIRADPANSAAGNMLGYAQAFTGDLDAARKAFDQYGRQPGQATNALDSLGEAYFINGKFAEAEQAFLQAYAKDPSFLGGAPLWKAAHARWLKGDLPGADALVERYLDARVKARDPLADWRRANWLYETGRQDQAVALLMRSPSEIAARQLAVWKDPDAALPDLERLYQNASPVEDGLPRTFYAAALLQAGRRDQARQLLARWPLPETGDSLFQSLMYPRFLALKKALSSEPRQ